MYEEVSIKRKINWKPMIIKLSAMLAIVFIVCALIFAPEKTFASTPLNSINNNLLKAGKKYFDIDNYPTKISDYKIVTLMEIVENDLVKAETYNKEKCDFNKSYVKIVKVDNKDYSIYSFLNCNNVTDTVASNIKTKEDNNKNVVNDSNLTVEVIE